MSKPFPSFKTGSVGHNLMLMRGVWHDHIELFELDGSPLNDDIHQGSGSPGASPFDNLVYIDFDGHTLKLTNVHFRGRPVAAKSFVGQMKDELLVFDALGFDVQRTGYVHLGLQRRNSVLGCHDLPTHCKGLDPCSQVDMVSNHTVLGAGLRANVADYDFAGVDRYAHFNGR